MTADKKEQLGAGARNAVLVRRSDLPVPLAHAAPSYFGGLPKLPPEFEWPRAEVRAEGKTETAALTFIAQIDLSELSGMGSVLPQSGTLYFFCSSHFEDGSPPCRVFYSPSSADALPEREPPSDLMALGGDAGFAQVKWLDHGTDLHSKVGFKYPISFLPFQDFEFYEDPVGGELLVESLCKALGPGEPVERDLLEYRTADDYDRDGDWPFNWLLIAHVARAVMARTGDSLRSSPYRKPLSDETREALLHLEAGANRWLEISRHLRPLESVAPDAKTEFRAWWASVALKFAELDKQLPVYPSQIREDLGEAINYNIRHMAVYDDPALANAPQSYVENLRRQNYWKSPTAKQGKYRFFSSAIHQMLGYGSSWQGAPSDHRDDVLLLQVQGDNAFFDWHTNCGCMLHFWISRDALSKLDFSGVEATLECD